jgi:carbamoyltransferase
MRTNVDYLALGPFLLAKEEQPEWTETQDWRDEIALD